MVGRRITWLTAAAVACGLVWLAEAYAVRGERLLQIELRCVDDGCTVRLDGGPALRVAAPSTPDATRVGLYAYQPHEFPGRPYFRDLRLETDSGPSVSYSLLDAADTPAAWRGHVVWHPRSGVGLGPRLKRGERSTLLLDGEYRDFNLTVEVVDPTDVGIVFRARDEDFGTVAVARPHYNDAFLFELDGGRAGGPVAFESLGDLSVVRESLRLGGLACRIALPGLLLALAILGWRSARQASPPSPEPEAGHDAFGLAPWALASILLFLYSLVALYAFGGVPHIADESAYLFQARIFAGGMPWAPSPDLPDFFLHEHIVSTPERWFAKYPPLFPALLALGVAAGVPWIVNPLFGAALGGATFLLAREVSDVRWATLAGALAATSPFLLVMNATLMSHSVTGLLVTVALWLTIRAARRLSVRDAALAGFALGGAALARPFTAFLVALAIGGWLGVGSLRAADRKKLLVVTVTLVLCALPALAAFAMWTAAYTGDVGVHSYSAYEANDTLGFGPHRGEGWLMTWGSWGHTPAKALRSTHQFLDYFSRDLLGWPARLSLGLLVAGLAIGTTAARTRSMSPTPTATALLLGSFMLIVAGHALYWATQHIAYGARYWFEAAPALIVVLTLGLRNAREALGPSRRGLALGGVALAALVIANVGGYLPARIAELPHYGGIGSELKREVALRGLTDAVIFVQTQGLFYNDGFHMNDPLTWTYPIFARDLGPRNAELLRRHPGHPGYRWDGERLMRLPDPSPIGTLRLTGSHP